MLCPMRSWSAAEWPAVRARGKNDFLLRYGFLLRGLPLGVIAGVVIESLFGGQLPASLGSGMFWVRLVGCVAVFTLSGCMTASVNWNLHERRHAGV